MLAAAAARNGQRQGVTNVCSPWKNYTPW